MAHGNVREFDPAKESMEDFQQRFEFYCLANNIKADDEAQITRKKALFVTMLGQDLANPHAVTELSLNAIVELLPHTFALTLLRLLSALSFLNAYKKKMSA